MSFINFNHLRTSLINEREKQQRKNISQVTDTYHLFVASNFIAYVIACCTLYNGVQQVQKSMRTTKKVPREDDDAQVSACQTCDEHQIKIKIDEE